MRSAKVLAFRRGILATWFCCLLFLWTRNELGQPPQDSSLNPAPAITYSTFLGGSGLDEAYAIAVDSSGNAYIAGDTDATGFPSTHAPIGPGGGTCDGAPCLHIFVAKLNSAGSGLDYATILGGSNEDHATGIAVDSSGAVYVTGYTASSDFPTLNAFQPTSAGGNCGSAANPSPCFHAFVAKVDPSGAHLIYSTYLGGSGNDLGAGIAVDSSGAAYVTGSTSSPDFLVTSGVVHPDFGGGAFNAFVTKLNPSGSSAVYSTYLGGSGEDHAAGIAVDDSGDAFVTGYTNSNDFPTVNALQGTFGGGTCGPPSHPSPCFDAFVAKVNPSGSALLYSTFLGGSGGDYGYAIALDSAGDAFITGFTTSTNFPVTPGAYQTTGGGSNYDAFVAKLSSSGSVLGYSTYLGGIGNEIGYGIAVDAAGNALLTGSNIGGGFPLASPIQSANHSFYDAFATKLNASGSALIFSTYLGGSGDDVGRSIAADNAGNVFIGGGTFSSDFPTTSGAFQPAYGGAYDGFIAKISGIALPVCALSQSNVNFPGQGENTTSAGKSVTLSNSGDAALTITDVVASPEFDVTEDCGGSVAPGASCTLTITSTPAGLGPRPGTVTITDNAWGSPQVIGLTGVGLAADVTISSSALVFGNQLVGTTSGTQSFTVSNPGAVGLVISGIASSGDFAQTNNCPGLLSAGGSCAINVTFTPTAAGARPGEVTITDSAADSPQSIAISGMGTAPSASLTPTAVAFPGQNLMTTSPPQSVTLLNTGTATLMIARIITTGDFADADPCGGSLAPGASCTIPITFTPTGTGARSGTLTLTDNAEGAPQSIALTGMGIAPAVALAATSLTFASQGVATTSAAQAVHLTNSGTGPLAIGGIAASGDFAETNTCGSLVAAGAACDVAITFSPTAMGVRSGTLTITDNAAGSPHIIALTGSGVVAFALGSVSTSVTIVRGMDTATFPISVSSPFGYSGTVSLSCAASPAALCTLNPASVAPGQTSTLSVSGLATLAATSAALTVSAASNAQNTSLTLSVLISDFTITPSPSSSTIAAGQSATFALSLSPTNSFAQPISLTCSGAPADSTCSVSPSPATMDGSHASLANVSVITTARSQGFGHDFRQHPIPSWDVLNSNLFWLLVILFMAALASVPGRRNRWRIVAPCLAFLFVLPGTACGGGGGGGGGGFSAPTGTPAGAYTITISAATGALSHSVTINLVVD